MADPEDLARRYLAIWADYLAALCAEAAAAPSSWQSRAGDAPATAGSGPAGNERREPDGPGPPAGTPPVAGASGERDAVMDELARRLADLEQRLARVERGRRAVAGARRRDRRARA